MTALEEYINEQNQFNALFRQPQIKSPTNFDESKPHFKSLTAKLEPENLYCDGEANQEQVSNQLRFIAEVWNELETISGREVEQDDAWNF